MMNNKMDLYNNLKGMVREIETSLRGVVYSSQLSFSLLRLFFLKYAVDNFIGADNIDSMKTYAEAQKAFAMRDLNAGFAVTQTILGYIDEHYNLYSLLSNSDNIENYSRELFGTVLGTQSVKKNANPDYYKAIIAKLATVDLKETSAEHEKGKMLVYIFYEEIMANSYRSSYSAEYTTSESISKIAGEILDIKSDDYFCDFVAGIGMSTISITKDAEPAITSIEKDITAAAASAMLYIMWGYKDFHVYCEDSLSRPAPGGGGNKIFADLPLIFKTDANYGIRGSKVDGVVTAVDRVINNYLEEGGTAVVTVPGRFLFQRSRPTWEIKAELVRKRYLSAVIALPPLWNGTNIGTNLLVITKKNNRGVVFIDVSDRGVKSKSSPLTTITEETNSLIISALNNKRNQIGVSKFVSYSRIEECDFDMVPANYIEKAIDEDTTTIEDIDAQLTALYKQIETDFLTSRNITLE